jgi:hypothetical protein
MLHQVIYPFTWSKCVFKCQLSPETRLCILVIFYILIFSLDIGILLRRSHGLMAPQCIIISLLILVDQPPPQIVSKILQKGDHGLKVFLEKYIVYDAWSSQFIIKRLVTNVTSSFIWIEHWPRSAKVLYVLIHPTPKLMVFKREIVWVLKQSEIISGLGIGSFLCVSESYICNILSRNCQ